MPNSAAASPQVDGEAIAVLHVDDNDDFTDLVAAFLERVDQTLEVSSATDPEAALEQIRAGSYDAVVSDFDMPGLNGLELLERVREFDERLPFVLFTGKGSEDIASEAISKGVTDYLQKSGGQDQYEVLANRVTNAVERYRAQRQVERGQAAMNTAWDGISIIDDDGRFTYVNDAYGAVFGYEPGDLEGEPWTTVYPEGGEARVHDEILPMVAEAGTWTGETTLRRATGEEFVGAHAVAGLADGGAVCVVRDLTDRHELDRALQHERDRFRLLVETVDGYAIFMLDTEGRIASWNAGAERIKGYDADEILGQHFSTFYPEDTAAGGLPEQLLERAAEQGSTTDQGLRVRKDGSTFWADVTITALYDDGELRGYGKVTEDITEQVEREQREERNEEYRRELYQITSDPSRGLVATVDSLLDLGVERLDVANGFVSFIDPDEDHYEIVAAARDHPEYRPGAIASLSSTFCRRAIESDEILGIGDTVADGWAEDPAYEEYGFSCYLGAKLEVEGDLIGTVCFIDWTPRSEKFRHDEKAFVHLLARWLSAELRSQDRRDRLRARNA